MDFCWSAFIICWKQFKRLLTSFFQGRKRFWTLNLFAVSKNFLSHRRLNFSTMYLCKTLCYFTSRLVHPAFSIMMSSSIFYFFLYHYQLIPTLTNRNRKKNNFFFIYLFILFQKKTPLWLVLYVHFHLQFNEKACIQIFPWIMDKYINDGFCIIVQYIY